MEQNSEVSRLMDSLHMLIDRSDEPGDPAPSQIQRLEATLQIIDGKLSEHHRMHDEALASIKQLTDVLVCQGQLLAKMHQRQETTARDMDMVTTEVKQARADTMSQLQLIARAQVATTSLLQTIRPISQGAMPTIHNDFVSGPGYSSSQRSIHSPVSAHLSPVSSQASEYLSINQVALHAPMYGGPVTPQSADFAAAAATDTRRTHNAVTALAQQQQLTQQQQQAIYLQLQKQQQQQQQRLRSQHQHQMALQQQQQQMAHQQQQSALQSYMPATQPQHQNQYQFLQQQQQLFAQAASAQQQQQRVQYVISPAPVISNSLVSATPDLSPNTSTPVKIEPAEATPVPIQELTAASSTRQERMNQPVSITEQPPQYAPAATTNAKEVSRPVATMAAIVSAVPPAAPVALAALDTQRDIPTTAPAVKTTRARVPAPTPTKATAASAPIAVPKPVASKPIRAVSPSMMPVSLIKTLSPAAAKASAKLGSTSKTVTPSKPSVATPASAVVPTQPLRSQIEDAATAAARAAIPQVLTVKSPAASVPKKSELKSTNGSSHSTESTTAKRIATVPAKGVATSSNAQALVRKQDAKSSSSHHSSLASMSMSESGSVTPAKSNEHEPTKHRSRDLLDGELEKSGTSAIASSCTNIHPSRVRQMESSSRAHSTRQRSNSRSRRYWSRSRSGSRSRHRSRSGPRSGSRRHRSRSLSRSLSTGRSARRSSSRSRGGWTDTTNDVKLSIKGQTRSRRDDEPATGQPSKYRAISPRVDSVMMFSSDNDGSGSGSDVEDLIEQRIVRSSSPELGAGNKVAVIGIVGASSSKQSTPPHTDISSRLGARIPVFDDGDDVYAHRHGDVGFPLISSSNYSGDDHGYAQQSYGAQQSHPDPRYRSKRPLLDISGNEITPARMSKLLGPFCFMILHMVPTAYRQIFGCQPIPSGLKPQDFNRMLTKMEGFQFWSLSIAGTNFGRPIYMNFLQRDGVELGNIRKNMLRRLALTEGANAVVLGPLLSYFLITLACMRVDQMTGPILDRMFTRITGRALGTLRVVTENGIRRMTAIQICEMAKTWVTDLCLFIARGSRMQESQDLATKCYEAYVRRYRATGSNSVQIDTDGAIAREMLANNEDYSRMFLGIRATELIKLYMCLVCMINGEVDSSTKTYLKEVSHSLTNQLE
ncbi:hypothetical protein GGH13_006796 [Coemansia sp. S155-1]|nr:hypothetical protein GGH13_006796 [Coemansia sp. S155-1]